VSKPSFHARKVDSFQMMEYVVSELPLALLFGALVGIIFWRFDTTKPKLIASIGVGVVGAAVGGFISWSTNNSGFVLRLAELAGSVILILLLRSVLPRRQPVVGPSAQGEPSGVERDLHEASRLTPVNAQAGEPGVFISYRRQDVPDLAGRLYDRLARHFGDDRVFMDVDSIEPGLDFGEVIRRGVASCAVMLVIIGDKWLTAADAQGRPRLDNSDDYIRLEIEAALSRNIRVIPVLVGGVLMPRSQELPDSLSQLARRNALEISHVRFSSDAARLIAVIENVLTETSH
jgi:uncharacterized membrane protein YeaQ/YmgE (transglycosylase-associated protein family)